MNLDPNSTEVPGSNPTEVVDQTATGKQSSFNWNAFFNTMGTTATGLFGNGGNAANRNPSGPPFVFESKSNSTLWIVLIVLVLAAVLAFYLIKKR
ncbi:hypothetical protein [Croceimicrobium hydrocarbonivorans]|uniref:Uncharacterized protein n=1 Tax=Croceimicrobium hydrocarbonivorans TaxID=2761580 RepID=A0A7H0VB99_9FLAO|nr:hypothetical protein [Croceimicrobium hydrocarbonivorans]QNR22954.1 hypothetical protein H4K34_11250 [Croceimicrobium hydrocarbonivorans]QNR22997.1 hypothetical protein H4K34_11465 [Croceimicrobium hydrocarbonivorans]